MDSKRENFGSKVNVDQKSSFMEKALTYHGAKILSWWVLISHFPQSLQLLLNRLLNKVTLVWMMKIMQKLSITDLTSTRLTYLLPLMTGQLAAGTNFEWPLSPIWGTVSEEPAINYNGFLSWWKGQQLIFLCDDYLAFTAHQASPSEGSQNALFDITVHNKHASKEYSHFTEKEAKTMDLELHSLRAVGHVKQWNGLLKTRALHH